jgi:hypothetical protein
MERNSMIMLATSSTGSKRNIPGEGMLFVGGVFIEGVVYNGMVKKSESKSHDHEVQRVSKTAAKTAENASDVPETRVET